MFCVPGKAHENSDVCNLKLKSEIYYYWGYLHVLQVHNAL